MRNDNEDSSKQEPIRINIDDEQTLHHWATEFDVTPQQVKDAVTAVGTLAADVEMHLKGSRSTTNSERVASAGE